MAEQNLDDGPIVHQRKVCAADLDRRVGDAPTGAARLELRLRRLRRRRQGGPVAESCPRDVDDEARSPADLAVDRDPAAVALDDQLDDVEAQAEARDRL